MTPFIVRAYQPGRINVAYFADLVTFGALFFHGDRAAPIHFDGVSGYLVYAIPSPNKRADLRGLATIQYAPDLSDQLEKALAPAGWKFERIEQTAAARGRMGGRPPALSKEQLDNVKIELRSASQSEVARRHGLAPCTLSNILRRDRKNQGDTHA